MTPVQAPIVDPLGRTLALDDGDLVVGRQPGAQAGRTLLALQGLPALAQALTLAIETQVGTDPLNVTFGFDRLALAAGQAGRPALIEHIRLELVRCVAADRRVLQVRSVTFEPMTPSRRVRARVEVETARGDVVSLDLAVPRV